MRDVQDMLATLSHAVTPGPAGADVVAADVTRGHQAMKRNRRRRFAGLGAATAAVAAVAVAVIPPAHLGRSAPEVSAGGSSSVTAQTTKVRLVAYTGAQPAGFTVSTVPAGWQVIASDDYSFVVAPPGAPVSQPDSFVGRIVVMLQGMSEFSGDSHVTQVTVNGKEGQLGLTADGNTATGAKWLIFPDAAGHKVLVQVPTSLGLTDAQIVSFAQGITVTRMAKAGVG
jgi:hypothetical protein